MNQKARDFAFALDWMKEKGWNPWSIFTQAWHETGRFEKVIGQHNYWGIKYSKNWNDLRVQVRTHEYENGESVEKICEFADWKTVKDALMFYDDLVQRLYPQAYDARLDCLTFFRELVNHKLKWATDPAYPEKLSRVYASLKFDPSVREFMP